jgi:NTP pyrophosphatase (non-canonical NTP hydrolase)
MFRKIYGPGDEFARDRAFARIAEELGELAEAVRVFGAEPSYFISEAADLFAWLMHLQNGLDRDAEPSLGRLFAAYFPDACNVCKRSSCVCPPIQERTMGRIAHEVPTIAGSFREGGNLLPLPVIREHFKRAQQIRLGDQAIRVGSAEVQAILGALDELRGLLATQPDHSPELTNLMTRMVEQQRLTEDELIRLREVIERQPPGARSAIFAFFENVAANQVSGAIFEVARYLALR